jgi:hypothetical protein
MADRTLSHRVLDRSKGGQQVNVNHIKARGMEETKQCRMVTWLRSFDDEGP